MGNPVINYYNAVLEADIPCYPKTALLVLIKNMDYNTRQTYVGTTKIAKKMGASYNTARRALDALEKEHKLIKFAGMHLIHPGSADATQIFEVLIKPVPSEDASTLSGYNSPPSPATTTLRGRQSIQSGASTDSGVDLSGVDVVSRDTHTYTHSDADALEADSLRSNTKTTPTPKPASLKDSVPETQPGLLIPEPTANSVKAGSNGSAVLSGDDASLLARIFNEIAPAPDDNPFPALEDYKGPLSAARLALLMFWAFRVSNYWSKEDNWQVLDMENFLGASSTLDKQFIPEKWRQHDGLTKRLPTAEAVWDHLAPPAPPSPEEVCEEDEHVWDDYMLPEGPSHTVDRCAHCGKFRTKPAVNRWTAADDLEAEYMEMVEFYDPCDQRPSEEEIAALEAQHRRATERERNCDWTEAQPIVNRLKRTARLLDCRGYGIAQLVFSDWSSVSTTDWAPDALTEVETLLKQGERPLGLIAALRDRRGEPFVEPWQSGDEKACTELRSLAHFWYHHRM